MARVSCVTCNDGIRRRGVTSDCRGRDTCKRSSARIHQIVRTPGGNGSAALPGTEDRPSRVARFALVAVSPQTPDNSLELVESHSMTFEVLSDVRSVASDYGIVFALTPAD